MSRGDAAAIEVDDLGYTYPGRVRPTLCGVSLSLPAGSWTVVAGPTGSGKSTLLRALVGLIPHLSRGRMTGVVRLAGRDTRTLSTHELAQTAGFVLQSPDDQLCTTTVEAELAFGLENLNLPIDEIERRIADAAERFGLQEQLARPTPHLSGGMKQRLTLAAVTAMRPKILVCDEPLSRLDPPSAKRLLDDLRRLRDSGTTIVVAEHRLEAVVPWADRVVELRDGRIVDEQGAKERLTIDSRTQYRVPSTEPLLRVERLAYRYSPEAAAVWTDVSFEIRCGERIALFGPNGAGKSTLLAVSAGVLRPTDGHVMWPGTADRFPATLVPQRADLTLFNRTVADELAYGPRQLGLPADVVAARVNATAERLDLTQLLDEQPQALSQGQRVRTAVAAALTMSPRLLLLDEPTTGQDSAAMRAMLDVLSSAVGTSDGPEAVVFSTHDHETATRYADRVFRLTDGALTIESPQSDGTGGGP